MSKKVLLTVEEVKDFKNEELCFGKEFSMDAEDCDIKSCPDRDKCEALFNGTEWLDISKADAAEVFEEADKKPIKKPKVEIQEEALDKNSVSFRIQDILEGRKIVADIIPTTTRDKFVVEGEQIIVAGKRGVKFCLVESGDKLGLDDIWEKSNVGFQILYANLTPELLTEIVDKYFDKLYGDVSEVEEAAEPKKDFFEDVEEEEPKIEEESKIIAHGVSIYELKGGMVRIEMLVEKDKINWDQLMDKIKAWFE